MLSADDVDADINQGVIESWSRDIDIVSDWIHRFTDQLEASNPDDFSTVYVAGKHPKPALRPQKS
jgi:hypothetical protein